MKRFFAVLLSMIMVFSLAACSGQNSESSSWGSSSEESTPPESSSELTESSTESTDLDSSEAAAKSSDTVSSETSSEPSGGKTLVVYYSATGNTEAVAEYIAGATGGDLFELVPTEPYTSDDLDWTNRDSRVSREHDDESLRVVELENAVPDNWNEYNKVFIGYPKMEYGLNMCI